MEDLVISTDTANVLSQSIVTNTVRVVDSEPVLIASETGTVVTLESGHTVLIQVPTETLVVTGLIGPAGPAGSSEEDQMYAKRVDFINDNLLYRGEAAVGSSESNAVWRIRKLVIGNDGDVTETWAGGTAAFDKVWADRLTLIYS